jgi:hypothetical protein
VTSAVRSLTLPAWLFPSLRSSRRRSGAPRTSWSASVGARHETRGTPRLYIDDQVVAEAQVRTQPGHFALCGEGLSIGRDTGDAVSKEYTPHFPFTAMARD